MINIETTQYNLTEAIEKIQIVREKVHLGSASHQEIEDLLEFEKIIHEDNLEIELQSEFWA